MAGNNCQNCKKRKDKDRDGGYMTVEHLVDMDTTGDGQGQAEDEYDTHNNKGDERIEVFEVWLEMNDAGDDDL